MASAKKTSAPKKGKAAERTIWQRPLGHDDWMQGLWTAGRSGRLPHAMLLTGRQGIGKFAAMRWLAAGFLCEKGPDHPCLECGPCKRLMADTHPDCFEVDARAHGLDALTVAFFAPRREARTSGYNGPSVGEFLSLRSAEGGYRVVLVREAERMNASAQNAFLKTLEEPAPGTLLIMETSQPGALLATIQSRVIVIPVPPLAHEDALAVLTTKGALEEDAHALVRLAQGSPGLALIYRQQSRLAMLDVLEACMAGDMGALEARRQIMELKGTFEGKTPTAQTRDRARCLLDTAIQWVGDAERLAAGLPAEGLALGDRVAALAAWPSSIRRATLHKLWDIREDVSLNLNAESLLDRAFLALPTKSRGGAQSASRP